MASGSTVWSRPLPWQAQCAQYRWLGTEMKADLSFHQSVDVFHWCQKLFPGRKSRAPGGAIWVQFCVIKCWCASLCSFWCPMSLPSQRGMDHCVWCGSQELCALKLLQKSLWQHPPVFQRAKQTPWEWTPKKSNTKGSSKYSTYMANDV